MTSQQIEYVLTLAKERNFSKAAQKLFVTQPSLSQFIMSVEKQLGTTLFDRTTNPIRLTPAGEAYVKAAERIQAIEDNLHNEISDIQNLEKGTLKIGASTFRSSCLLSQSISTFCKLYQGIHVTIVEDSIDALTLMVRNRELDVLIGTGNFDNKLFHTEELAKEEFYLAVPDHLTATLGGEATCLSFKDIKERSLSFIKKKPLNLALASDLPFIVIEHGEFGAEMITSICKEYGFEPLKTLTVKTIETAFSLVNAGLGITFIPDTLIQFGNYFLHPNYYSIQSSYTSNMISLVSRKDDYFSKAATEYCLTLKKLVDIGTWRVL